MPNTAHGTGPCVEGFTHGHILARLFVEHVHGWNVKTQLCDKLWFGALSNTQEDGTGIVLVSNPHDAQLDKNGWSVQVNAARRLGLHTIATAALYICSRVVDLCRE